MRKNRNKNNYYKYVVILLAVAFLISAAFLFLNLWEKQQGLFPFFSDNDEVIVYNDKKYTLKENVETFLVLGLDKYIASSTSNSYNNDKQADFLMLFVFDNDKKTFSAIHINRDTMTNVRVLAVDETKVVAKETKQVALAHTYGRGGEASCRNTADSVSDILQGMKIDHYMSFTMDSVTAINDFVGGVEVTVLDDFKGIDDSLIKGEKITLMGQQALNYVRSRSGLEDSTNITRMKRQQQYINSLYDNISAKIDADDGFIIKLIDKIDDYVVYDSSDHRMQKYAEKFNEYEFQGIKQIKGESVKGEEFMEFYPNRESVMEIVISLFYKLK